MNKEQMPEAGSNDSVRHLDFDVHGIVGIRLVDPSLENEAALQRALGNLQHPLGREPDIHVRFVEHLPMRNLRYVEVDASGFTDDRFFILRSGKKQVRVQIPFDQIGDRCEIVCQSGTRSVPLLLDIIKLTALRKGVLPLHASAFEYKGTGVLVTGWAHGGKTSALLGFAQQGARYLADDTVLLRSNGKEMLGIPTAVGVSAWQMSQLGGARNHIRRSSRLLLKAVNWLEHFQELSPANELERTYPSQLLTTVLPPLQRRTKVYLPPEALFSRGRIGSCEPQKFFLVLSQTARDIRIDRVDPEEFAHRVASSLRADYLSLFGQYLSYKFAFPDRTNVFLEHAHELQQRLLDRALAGKETYVIRHPYPVRPADLYEAMKPYCHPHRAAYPLVPQVEAASASLLNPVA